MSFVFLEKQQKPQRMDDTESSKETLGSTQMGTGTTISSDSSQQAAKTMSGAQVYKQVQLYKENAVLHCCPGSRSGHLQSSSAGASHELCVPPQCSDASSDARSDVSNFSSHGGYLEVLLLSGESETLETLSCHMTGPTAANEGLARKLEFCSMCTETLHPASLLEAGLSPWHAGALL